MNIKEFEEQARLDGVDIEAVIDYYERRGQQRLDFHELSAVRIFSDMAELRAVSVKSYIVVEYMLTHPLYSIREIAEAFTVPRTSLTSLLKQTSKKFDWLEKLMELKKRQCAGGRRPPITSKPSRSARRSRA